MENIPSNFQPVSSPSKNPYKILFFVSLGLFLVTITTLLVILLTKKTSESELALIPTPTVKKQVTSTNPTVTPTTSTSTVVQDIQTSPTPTTIPTIISNKTTFQNMITDFTLYKDITSTERADLSGIGEWLGEVKSTDSLYSFIQKILKGSFKKLTISKENLKTIKGDYLYTFYITPNYENWSNEEFQKIDFNKYMTGIGQMAPLYAYSDKLVWKEFSCGGVISTSSNECQSLTKELNTAFP